MLDPMNRRRRDFSPGRNLTLADGQLWPLPDPFTDAGTAVNAGYKALIVAIVEVDRPEDSLRAELALAIHLFDANYDLPPLILGALLDFPRDDPALVQFQSDLHELAMDHARAYRHPDGTLSDPPFTRRFPHGFGLFRGSRSRLTA